jgi:hypothetical protein
MVVGRVLTGLLLPRSSNRSNRQLHLGTAIYS